MTEDKDNESFDDEFDFVEDDEFAEEDFNASSNAAISKPTAKFSVGKIISITGGIVILGIIIVHFVSKKPAPNKTAQQLPTPTEVIPEETQIAENKIEETPIIPANELGFELSPTNQEQSREEIAKLFNDTSLDNSSLKTQEILTEANNFKQQLDKLEDEPEQKSGDNAEIQQALADLNQEINNNFDQIKKIESALTNISDTLGQLNQRVVNMDNSFVTLNDSIDVLAKDLNNVKKVIADEDLDLAANKPANKKPTLTYQNPEYSVHAIIPGRAWLKSTSGNIITVAEGDSVGDYGTVAVIDAANNIVRTSSGISFR